MLELKNIKKSYKTGEFVQHALKGVSLTFDRNEFVCILGASGSGKTTFGKLIAGLEKPTDGKVWFQGQEMQDLSEKQFRPYRKNLQMVFQDLHA